MTQRFLWLGCALLEALGLAVLLTIADAWIGANPRKLADDPIATGRSLSWMALAYTGIVLGVLVVFRKRSRVVAVTVMGFALAWGASWLFWSTAGSVTEAGWRAPAALLLGALGLAWLAAYVVTRSELPARAARVFAVGALVVPMVSFLAPRPPVAPPPEASWPEAKIALSETEAAPNLLIVTLDTVRPDHLGAYGYSRIETPRIDRIAETGALFEFAIAQAPVTPPSHASLFTGLYPVRHGMRDFREVLGPGPDVVPLAEILKGAGYTTGAMVAAAPLAPAYGLSRGFDVYHYVEPPDDYTFRPVLGALLPRVLNELGLARAGEVYRHGPDITDDALRWIDRYGRGPFFLWVHYFDAHTPYRMSLGHRRPRLHPGTTLSDQFRPAFAYDTEIVGIDAELGRLLEALHLRGVLDETILVLASDHGEGLGDHSYYGHTQRVYQEQLRIALILRYPPRIPPGIRIETQVRSTDVLPTILELMGLPSPAGLDGESLLPLLAAKPATAHRFSISELLSRTGDVVHLVAASDGHYKLIGSVDGQRWLFDLQQDPGEERNLTEDRPAVRKRLEAELMNYLEQSEPEEEGRSSPAPWQVDEDLEQRLRALGYLE